MPLLGLQAVDREDQRIDPVVVPGAGPRGLAGGRRASPGSGGCTWRCRVGEVDGVGVEQFAADLGDRPVACEAAMADPAEDVPADAPAGQGDGRLRPRGSWSWRCPGQRGSGQWLSLQTRWAGPSRREEVAMAVVADVHRSARRSGSHDRGRRVPRGRSRYPRASVRHGVDLRVARIVLRVDLEAWQEDTRRTPGFLAPCLAIVFFSASAGPCVALKVASSSSRRRSC